MKLPTVTQCRRLMEEMQMPAHIVAHSLQVARVARWLRNKLGDRLPRLDRDLIEAAALLHDITKARSFTTGEDHAATGEVFLAELGFAEVGRVVAWHVKLEGFDPLAPISAAEVVNYADKRVLHDRIVPLDQRMAYILERYGGTDARRQRIASLWQETRVLEAKLFGGLDCGPDAIDRLEPMKQDLW